MGHAPSVPAPALGHRIEKKQKPGRLAPKRKGDPFEGIALESTGVVLGGDKQEKTRKQ
jgi:hypothetical protein